MNITGNISVGNPIALQMIPLQKSTLGQSFLSMKQGSLKAILSSSIAIQTSSSLPVTSKTSQATFLMILALGSQFLQTRCPNPYNSFFRFFTSSIYWGIFYFFPIDSSILNTASLAPPCFGPYKAPDAPAIAVQISTPDDDRCRTAAVEQFSSCSTCKINKISRALDNFGCGLKSLSLSLSIMYKKFSTQLRFSAGLLYYLPILWRQAFAANVGTLPIILQICLFLIYLFLQMVSPTNDGFCSGWTVESAESVLQSMPIGCASYLKDFINSPTSVCKNVCSIIFLEKLWSSFRVGSSPKSTKKATSKKFAFYARTSIGQPRYSRIPLSPSIYEIVDVQVIVFIYPGSQLLKTFPLNAIFWRSVELTCEFLMGISYVLLVLESVTERESLALTRSAIKDKRFIKYFIIQYYHDVILVRMRIQALIKNFKTIKAFTEQIKI